MRSRKHDTVDIVEDAFSAAAKILDDTDIEEYEDKIKAVFTEVLEEYGEYKNTYIASAEDFYDWFIAYTKNTEKPFPKFRAWLANNVEADAPIVDKIYACFADFPEEMQDELFQVIIDHCAITTTAAFPSTRVSLVLAYDTESYRNFQDIKHMARALTEPVAFQKNALLWLLVQQGARFADLTTSDRPFPKSVKQELLATSPEFSTLTVHTLCKLDILADALRDHKVLCVDKHSAVGIFDPYTSATGPFALTLDKDILLPTQMIFDIILEERGKIYALRAAHAPRTPKLPALSCMTIAERVHPLVLSESALPS